MANDIKSYNQDLLKAFMKGIDDVNELFVKDGTKQREILKTRATKLGIEKYLNDNFDSAQRRIFIDNIADNAFVYWYLEAETRPENYFFLESEGEPPQYWYTSTAGDEQDADFTVNIPTALITGDLTEDLITSEVARFAFADKTYKIILF